MPNPYVGSHCLELENVEYLEPGSCKKKNTKKMRIPFLYCEMHGSVWCLDAVGLWRKIDYEQPPKISDFLIAKKCSNVCACVHAHLQ